MLPQSATSKVQPCDQGVIRSLKASYREKLARLLLTKEAKKVSLYEGLMMVRASWSNVTEQVVRNCWKKSGLTFEESAAEVVEMFPEEVDRMADYEDQEPVAEEPETNLDVILAEMHPCEIDEPMSESDEEEPEPTLPTTTECLAFLRQIRNRFIFSTGEAPDSIIELEQGLMRLPQKQPVITDFFKAVNP